MRLLVLVDWLPPDFGAVGQYALAFARDHAEAGHAVTLVGFSSQAAISTQEAHGAGTLTVRRIHRPQYDKSSWWRRATWTLRSNLSLLWGAGRDLFRCDELRFTGSPPYMIHFAVPVAKLLRRRTRYRITDFHPECLIATLGRRPWWLRCIASLTNFWRRRIDCIEVLGEDQRRRIEACGVRADRIELLRDPSPVTFAPNVQRTLAPQTIRSHAVILYSGNWGVAHDHETFVAGMARFTERWPARAAVWLNATGNRANVVEAEFYARGIPHARTQPVPLEELPSLLVAADLHLITLRDPFVGYVLPSKVYACIASGRPVLFVGSPESDVHLMCSTQLPASQYRRVDIGDVDGLVVALDSLLPQASSRQLPMPVSADQRKAASS